MMLVVKDLDAFYGRAQVLFGMSLDVGAGEVVVLLGRNGAGKSTTLKAIVGLAATGGGTVAFDGARIERMPTHAVARLGIGYVPEDRRIFSNLTVMENLEVGRRPARDGRRAWTPERLFELFPNLGGMRDRPGGLMSGGEQQMLTIARTLMGNPRLVLLDEPSEGLAPVIVEEMARTVRALKAEGMSVLLCEQNLHFAEAVADRAYVVEKGRGRFAGTMAALMGDAQARASLLEL